MPSATTVINNAARMIGIIGAVETLDGELFTENYNFLQSLLSEYASDGMGLPITAFPDTGTNVTTISDGDALALSYALALRRADIHAITLPPGFLAAADSELRKLRWKYFVWANADVRELPITRVGFFDVVSGTIPGT